jgi:DNA-binding CsgD family transcriptional regulator
MRAFRRSLVPMLVADDDHRYVDANPAACLLFRLPLEALLRLGIEDVTPPEHRDELPRRWAAFLAAGSETGTYPLVLPDGGSLSIDYSAVANVSRGRHLSIFMPHGWDEPASGAATEGAGEQGGDPDPVLTARELEVLNLIALGATAEDIAERLTISGYTVRTHIRNARLKLGATSRAHAIALAFREGLVS